MFQVFEHNYTGDIIECRGGKCRQRNASAYCQSCNYDLEDNVYFLMDFEEPIESSSLEDRLDHCAAACTKYKPEWHVIDDICDWLKEEKEEQEAVKKRKEEEEKKKQELHKILKEQRAEWDKALQAKGAEIEACVDKLSLLRHERFHIVTELNAIDASCRNRDFMFIQTPTISQSFAFFECESHSLLRQIRYL